MIILNLTRLSTKQYPTTPQLLLKSMTPTLKRKFHSFPSPRSLIPHLLPMFCEIPLSDPGTQILYRILCRIQPQPHSNTDILSTNISYQPT